MVILLTGPDAYRSHQRLHQLLDAFRKKYDSAGLSTVVLDPNTLTLEVLRSAVNSGGLFSQRRCVVLSDLEAATGIDRPDLVSALTPMVKNDDVVVIIREATKGSTGSRRSRAKRPSTKKKLSALEIPGAKVEVFEKLSEPQLIQWTVSEAKSRGGTIERAAAEQLSVQCQGDTWRISSELDKLLAFAIDRPITLADIQAMIQSPYESNIFSVTDAIGQGRVATAVHLIHRELAAGTHPLVLVAALASHIRNLWVVKRAGQSTPQAIAKTAGLHPYVVQKSLAQSRRFEIDQLRRLHHQLLELDLQLKSSSLDPETALDRFVVQSV